MNDLEAITILREFRLTERLNTYRLKRNFLMGAIMMKPPDSLDGLIAAKAFNNGFIKFKIGQWDYGGLPIMWLGQWFDFGANQLLITEGQTFLIETNAFPLILAIRGTDYRPLKNDRD